MLNHVTPLCPSEITDNRQSVVVIVEGEPEFGLAYRQFKDSSTPGIKLLEAAPEEISSE